MVVGDTTLADIMPVLEKNFGDWTAAGKAGASVAIPQVATQQKPRVFLIDQPGAVQANIVAAETLPSSTDAKACLLYTSRCV